MLNLAKSHDEAFLIMKMRHSIIEISLYTYEQAPPPPNVSAFIDEKLLPFAFLNLNLKEPSGDIHLFKPGQFQYSKLAEFVLQNHKDVLVVVDPADYPALLENLKREGDDYSFRRRLAWKAFQHVASYDSAVAEWFWKNASDKGGLFELSCACHFYWTHLY